MVMTLFDRLLAAIAALGAAARRLVGGSRMGVRLLIAVLLLASIVPSVVIGSSKRPTDLSFDDVRYQRLPAMTSWYRLEGDLRTAGNPVQPFLYELVDPADGTSLHQRARAVGAAARADDRHRQHLGDRAGPERLRRLDGRRCRRRAAAGRPVLADPHPRGPSGCC